ncbi:expressed protein [Phakopsora pachyrhizi]|uniref:Expressed protein n=1 Tax=Phakopsora pachyrhizi TaxID=170000 RepID=A0AAV0AR09_PHAPC|nr:expressed protein [Phakopsora pachyrhizi]
MSRVLEQIFVQLNKNAALLSVTDAGKDLELLALMANPTKKFISSLAFQDRSIIFAAQEIMLIKLRELGQRLAYNRYVTASEQKIYDFTTVLFERISAKLDQTYKDLKLPIKTRDPIPKAETYKPIATLFGANIVEQHLSEKPKNFVAKWNAAIDGPANEKKVEELVNNLFQDFSKTSMETRGEYLEAIALITNGPAKNSFQQQSREILLFDLGQQRFRLSYNPTLSKAKSQIHSFLGALYDQLLPKIDKDYEALKLKKPSRNTNYFEVDYEMPFTEMPPEMLKQILETKLDEAVAKPWLDRNLQGTHIIKTFRSQKVDYFAKIQETNVIFNRLNKMIIDETSQRDLELIAFIVKKDMVTRLNLSLMENVLDHLKTLRYKYQFSKKFGSYYEYTNQLYLHLLSRMGASHTPERIGQHGIFNSHFI